VLSEWQQTSFSTPILTASFFPTNPSKGVNYEHYRLVHKMLLHFKYLAIDWTFINVNIRLDIIRFAEMEELSVVVGWAAVKTQTKTLIPGQPVKLGRGFRGEGMRAEILGMCEHSGGVDEGVGETECGQWLQHSSCQDYDVV
jgi:hypothetical protein